MRARSSRRSPRTPSRGNARSVRGWRCCAPRAEAQAMAPGVATGFDGRRGRAERRSRRSACRRSGARLWSGNVAVLEPPPAAPRLTGDVVPGPAVIVALNNARGRAPGRPRFYEFSARHGLAGMSRRTGRRTLLCKSPSTARCETSWLGQHPSRDGFRECQLIGLASSWTGLPLSSARRAFGS